jgi:hypothetical protein
MSKKGLGDAEFTGKVKTQTFKQFQLERLIKDGTVIPASKLADPRNWYCSVPETLRQLPWMNSAIVELQLHHQQTS